MGKHQANGYWAFRCENIKRLRSEDKVQKEWESLPELEKERWVILISFCWCMSIWRRKIYRVLGDGGCSIITLYSCHIVASTKWKYVVQNVLPLKRYKSEAKKKDKEKKVSQSGPPITRKLTVYPGLAPLCFTELGEMWPRMKMQADQLVSKYVISSKPWIFMDRFVSYINIYFQNFIVDSIWAALS